MNIKNISFLNKLSHSRLADAARMLRWKNLLITALTMVLLRYTVISPVLNISGIGLQTGLFTFLKIISATLFIMAAGYVLNDIHDISIDAINHPDSMVVGSKISVPSAMTIYYIINVCGILLGLWAAIDTGYYKLSLIFIVAAAMLWYYATSYKRKFLSGNLSIAFLTSLVIITVWLFEYYHLLHNPVIYGQAIKIIPMFTSLCLGFALFAFIITLLREILKDVEDMQGDEAEGCKSIPIKWGIVFTKKLVMVLVIVTMILLGFAQYYLYKRSVSEAAMYYFVVQFMLYYLIQQVEKSENQEDYKFSTNLAKFIMLAGILGMEAIHLSYTGGVLSFG